MTRPNHLCSNGVLPRCRAVTDVMVSIMISLFVDSYRRPLACSVHCTMHWLRYSVLSALKRDVISIWNSHTPGIHLLLLPKESLKQLSPWLLQLHCLWHQTTNCVYSYKWERMKPSSVPSVYNFFHHFIISWYSICVYAIPIFFVWDCMLIERCK